MVELSVIIVTYNSAAAISACLDAVRKSFSNRPADEIIVVDNASTDRTIAITNESFPSINVHRNQRNLGFAAAANQGARIAKGNVLLFLNPDTIVQNGFMGILTTFMERTPDAAVVGAQVFDAEGTRVPSCWKHADLWTAFLESALPYNVSLPHVTKSPAALAQVDMVSGGCLAVRKETFAALGGFDEQFFLYYEDADFCRRAKWAGEKVFFLPDAKVLHQIRGSSSDDHTAFFRHLYRSKLMFFRKHSSALMYRLISLIVVSGIFIRIPVYYLAGVLFMSKHLRELSGAHWRALRFIVGKP